MKHEWLNGTFQTTSTLFTSYKRLNATYVNQRNVACWKTPAIAQWSGQSRRQGISPAVTKAQTQNSSRQCAQSIDSRQAYVSVMITFSSLLQYIHKKHYISEPSPGLEVDSSELWSFKVRNTLKDGIMVSLGPDIVGATLVQDQKTSMPEWRTSNR